MTKHIHIHIGKTKDAGGLPAAQAAVRQVKAFANSLTIPTRDQIHEGEECTWELEDLIKSAQKAILALKKLG